MTTLRPNSTGFRPAMLLVGAALLALGLLIMLTFVARPLRNADAQPSLSTTTTESLATAATYRGPSRMWAAAGGLSLAIGAGLIGIGLNSWRARRPRSIQPPDR